MDPQQEAIADEFDGYVKTYEDAINKSLAFSGLNVDFFTKVKAAYLVELMESKLGDTTQLSVIDVGCGVGIYHSLLAPKLNQLTGVDISSACLDRARNSHPDVSYAHYEGTRLPYEDATFDVAFTICVLHHVPPKNWANFAHEMSRVVRPGGLCAVFEHNPKNPLTMRVVNKCPFDADAVLLQSGKTAELLTNAGLIDVRSQYILNLPSSNRFLRRADELFSVFGLGAQYFTHGVKRE